MRRVGTVVYRFLIVGLMLFFLMRPTAGAEQLPVGPWKHSDYTSAFREADKDSKFLLLFFDDRSPQCRDFTDRCTDAKLVAALNNFVCARLPLEAAVVVNGRSVRLLDLKGFRSLKSGPGLALVDLKNRHSDSFERITATWPFGAEQSISNDDLLALLILTPTDRLSREPLSNEQIRQGTACPSRDQQACEASDSVATEQHVKNKAADSEKETSKFKKESLSTAAEQQHSEPCPARAGVPTTQSEASAATESHETDAPSDTGILWLSDYATAAATARRDRRMLLVEFTHTDDPLWQRFASEVWCDPEVVARTRRYVCVRVPYDVALETDDGRQPLLKHNAFSEMQGRPGLAIIDYVHPNSPYYETVVSQFPVTERFQYSARQVAIMLDLPPGTLTQRTLIYAVRTHPERPASADGELLPELQQEAERHSDYQARIQRQGHHFWERRFHRLNAILPRGLVAREVCAESWPGQGLLEAAIECVRCWRLSSGHWNAVRARHAVFGYDMKRGRNGVWYATGVFGGH